MLATPQLLRGLIIATVVAVAAGLISALVGAASWVTVLLNALAVCSGLGALLAKPRPTDDPPDMIAEVSHELRTPLTGILGTLELLTEPTIPLEPSEIDELLIAAHGDANHLLHIVSNLHARSRLDRSVLTPAAVPIDVRNIVEKAVGRSPQVARRCLFAPGGPAAVAADPQLVMQIVTNLVQNIERYAPDGSVRIKFSDNDGTTTAWFADSGPGIPTYRAEKVFTDAASTEGLGLGLSLSRQLARAMGGELSIDEPGEPGAVFKLELPSSAEPLPALASVRTIPGERALAHSPRARLLVDLADAFSGRTLDHVVGGIQSLYSDLLGATGSMLFLPHNDGSFRTAGIHEDTQSVRAQLARDIERVFSTGEVGAVDDISDAPWASEAALGGESAMLLPVHDGGEPAAVLVVGWKSSTSLPQGSAAAVAKSLAELIAPAIARTALSRDIAFERRLRASVMDELPIAVSVFAGDPPEVVDWNRKERQLLGLNDDSLRPSNLAASQHEYDVRFADGTALTVDNAPVTTAIRTGQAAGPFILRIRRTDGSYVHTRTYCAPFFDNDGAVAGAVVTSEALDGDNLG